MTDARSPVSAPSLLPLHTPSPFLLLSGSVTPYLFSLLQLLREGEPLTKYGLRSEDGIRV